MSDPFRLSLPGIASGSIYVSRFRGREAVNRPYQFSIHFLSQEMVVSDDLLGQRATLAIATSAKPRHITGVVTACELGARHRDGRWAARIRLEPKLATTRWSSGCRIFHDQSVAETVSQVLGEHEVPFALRLTAEHEKRAHRSQRNERDLDFLHRILADDGLFYWFENDGQLAPELLVIADAVHAYPPLSGGAKLRHVAGGSAVYSADDRTVSDLRGRAASRPNQYVRRWRDHQRPRLRKGESTLLAIEPAEAQAASPRAGLIYEHEHDLEDLSARLHPAKGRLDSRRWDEKLARGKTIYPHVSVGTTFQLEDHAETSLNRGYVVASVDHTGEAPEAGSAGPNASGAAKDRAYEASITLAPRETALRPNRRRKVTARGLETATVMGPPGEEIHTDELGRIQVRFHWDIEMRGTPPVTAWLRTSQPWAGANYGAHFTPRVGTEVLIGFVDGDADRPIVLGGLHNGTHPAPWQFPHDKTKSGIVTRTSPSGHGAGSNHLLFQDRAGDEAVSLHATRNLSVDAVVNAHMTVGAQYRLQVGGEASEDIGANFSSTIAMARSDRIEGARSAVIGGDDNARVGGDLRVRAAGSAYTTIDGAARTVISGGRHTAIGKGEDDASESIAVSGRYYLGVRRGLSLTSQQAISLCCGKSRIELLPDRILIESDEVQLHSSKSLSLLTEKAGVKSGMTFDDSAKISAPCLTLGSALGAAMTFDAQIKSNVPEILFNTGSGARPPAREDGDETLHDAVFEVSALGLPPGTTEVTLLVSSPTGETLERVCPVGGTATFQAREGETFTLQGIRVGDKVLPYQPVSSNPEPSNPVSSNNQGGAS